MVKLRKLNRKKSIARCFFWISLAITCQLLFTNCEEYYYGLANRGSENTYMDKPFDSEILATYGGLRGSKSLGAAYNPDDDNYFMEANLYQSLAKKYFGISYGGFGYFGNYFVNDTNLFFGRKEYFGAGGSIEPHLRVPLRTHGLWRPGIKITYVYETGDFARFRDTIETQKDYTNLHPNNSIFVTALTNDFAGKKDNFEYGLYTIIGWIWDGANDIVSSNRIMSNPFSGQLSLGVFIHLGGKGITGTFGLSNSFACPLFSAGLSYRFGNFSLKEKPKEEPSELK
jgi:hypothetical protein